MSLALSNPPRFLDLLKEIVDEEDQRNKEAHEGFRHYPSSSSYTTGDGKTVGACLRQLYWRTIGEPESDTKEFSNKLQALFGQAIHDGILKRLQKHRRIRVIPEAPGRVAVDGLTQEVSFRLDGLVTFEGTIGGLEIKTVQSYGLQRMLKEGGPKDKDLLQIVDYFATNPQLSWFSLVYFGRDTAYRAEFHITKRENKLYIVGITPVKHEREIPFNFEGVVARWKALEGYVERKELPPRDYKAVLTKDGRLTEERTKNAKVYKTDWTCLYCQYRSKCWSMPDAKQFAYQIPGD